MESNKQMSVLGVGPKLAVTTMVYSVAAFFLHFNYKDVFTINVVNRNVLIVLGILLVLSGLVFYAISAKTILKVHKEDKLITTGAYRVCRHPLYSAWIFLILPGIALLFASWILLTIPLDMYILLRIFIKTEEDYLGQRYPQEFAKYKEQVNLAFPCFWRLASK